MAQKDKVEAEKLDLETDLWLKTDELAETQENAERYKANLDNVNKTALRGRAYHKGLQLRAAIDEDVQGWLKEATDNIRNAVATLCDNHYHGLCDVLDDLPDSTSPLPPGAQPARKRGRPGI